MSKHENKNCSELLLTNGMRILVKALDVEDCEFVPVHQQQIGGLWWGTFQTSPSKVRHPSEPASTWSGGGNVTSRRKPVLVPGVVGATCVHQKGFPARHGCLPQRPYRRNGMSVSTTGAKGIKPSATEL